MMPNRPAGIACAVCKRLDFETCFSKQGYGFVRCTNCGAMHLDPIPSLEELKTHYASRTEEGNYHLGAAQEIEDSIVGTVAIVSQYIESRPGLRLLDIGCHNGQLLDVAEERHGWEGWGVELNPDAVAFAKRRHGDRVTCSTIEDFVPPNNMTFDVITAIAVVEHLREPGVMFEKIAAWLSEGGTCVLELPNAASLPARLMGRYWPPIAAPEHIWYLSLENIKAMSAEVGLDYVEWSRHWKKLSVGYVYNQLRYFGPELHKFAGFALKFLPTSILKLRLRFYGGEIYVVLKKALKDGAGVTS